MKNLISKSLICFILTSCSESEKESNNFYVIKEPKVNELSIHKTFYGQHNFILVDSNTIYYHDKYFHNSGCGTGIDFTKPPRLYLYPDSLKEINLKQFKIFLNTLKFNPTNFSDYSFASISSSTDTIKNKVFPILIDFLNSKTNLKFNIRKWTEEEEFVSIAKKEKKTFNPNVIKWKIGFGHEIPPIEEIIKFLPPKAEK